MMVVLQIVEYRRENRKKEKTAIKKTIAKKHTPNPSQNGNNE
jgi:hypothetical protein